MGFKVCPCVYVILHFDIKSAPTLVQDLLVKRLATKRRADWYTTSTAVKTRWILSWSIVYLSLRREIRDSEHSHLPCYCIVQPLVYRSLTTGISIDNIGNSLAYHRIWDSMMREFRYELARLSHQMS